MPTTVLPARQARSRETVAHLLKAAVEVLDADGLEGATVERIAARAGLTPGAVYRRFANKDALLREVCLRVLEENCRAVEAMAAPVRWAGQSLADMARFVIETTLRGHARHRGLLRALTFFTLEHPKPAFVRASEALQWRSFCAVRDLLLTRRDEIGHPDPDAAVAFALLMVGVAAKGVLVQARRPADVSRLMPDVEARLPRELPKMVLSYLGIDE